MFHTETLSGNTTLTVQNIDFLQLFKVRFVTTIRQQVNTKRKRTISNEHN